MRFRFATLSILSACIALGIAHAADSDQQSNSPEQELRAAHERLEQAAREVAELSTRMATEHMPDNIMFLGRNPNRAMLGIVMGEARDGEGDEGVNVLSVSPDGPAAKAGIKSGDVIVEMNGRSLKREKESSPHQKLLAEMSKLSPGDEITLRYLRDGKPAVVKLKVDRLPRDANRYAFRFPGGPGEPGVFDDDFLRRLSIHNGPFGDMELAPLSPKLGQYFGTEKGLLIVHAPQQTDLKLEDGDVLIDIDGRVPSNPGHAFRILDSYQPGEKVTLNILRQRKKVAVAIAMPESPKHHMRPLDAPRPPRPPSAMSPLSAPLFLHPSGMSIT